MMPNSHTSHHFVENDHYQNVDNVDFWHADNRANYLPVTAADTVVHSGTQSVRLEDGVSWKQDDVCHERVVQSDIVRPQTVACSSDCMSLKSAKKQHADQQNSCLVVMSDNRHKYLEPVTEPGKPRHSAIEKETGKCSQWELPPAEVNLLRNGTYVDEVYSGTAMVKDKVTVGAADRGPAVMLSSKTVREAQNSMDIAVDNAAATPVNYSIQDGKISDARRREGTEKNLHHVQLFEASSVSAGEVVVDTQDTKELNGVVTVADSATGLPVYEGNVPGFLRCGSTDKSFLQSSASISHGEVVIDTEGTLDLSETEAHSQSLAHDDTVDFPLSKAVDQLALNTGSS